MSGNDNVLINNLERALSTDTNNLQSVQARVLAELARFLFRSRVQGAAFVETTEPFLAGLAVTASGSDLQVGVGVLGQQSATVLPVPGPLDSDYRLSRLDTPATIAGPVPGVNTWYLVEAQATQVVASSVVRDIYNPGTGTFAPALVNKLLTNSIQFQLTAGGANVPLPVGGDWVPLAAVQFPAGGGAPLQIVDARPLPEIDSEGRSIDGQILHQTIRTTSTPDVPSNAAFVSASVVGPAGKLGGLYSGSLTASSVLEPGTVLAGSTWYYLWLCPWSAFDLRPSPGQLSGADFQGVLTVSPTPPSAGTILPSAPIQLPVPWSLFSTSDAVCVGAVRRNAANSGWVSSIEAAHQGSLPLGAFSLSGVPVAGTNFVRAYFDAVPSAVLNTRTVAVNLAGFVPEHASSVRLAVHVETSLNVGTGRFDLGVAASGSTFGWSYQSMGQENGTGSTTTEVWSFVDWPRGSLGDAIDVNTFCTASAQQLSVYVVGWTV